MRVLNPILSVIACVVLISCAGKVNVNYSDIGDPHVSNDVISANGLAEEPLSARELFEMRELGMLSVSPNGEFLSLLQKTPSVDQNTIEATWLVLDIDTSDIVARVDAGAIEVVDMFERYHDVVWAPDSKSLFLLRRIDGESQIWRYVLALDEMEKVTSSPADILGFARLPGSFDLAYYIKATREEVRAAEEREYRKGVNLEDIPAIKDLTGILSFPGNPVPLRNQSAGWTGQQRLLSNQDASVWVLEWPKRYVRPASDAEVSAVPGLKDLFVQIPFLGLWDASKSGVRSSTGAIAKLAPTSEIGLDVFKQSVPSAYQVAVEMAGESPIRCSHQACVGIDSRRGIGGVSWSHDENELIFKRHGDGYGPDELLAWDFKTDQLRTVYRSNGRLSSYSKSGRCPIIKGHLVCVETGALTPPILVSVNLQTGVSSQLFAPNAALRQRVELRFGDLVERFFWEGPYGQLNGGWLVKPADYEAGATEALVITSYTCDGLLRGGTGETTPEFLLAERGILALCVQSPAPTTRAYDPSDFYGDEAFEPLRTYKETVERWRAVIDLLEQRGFADPQRIGISGLSSSANALQYAISHTSLFTAAVSATASDHDPWVHFFYPGEQYSGLIEHFRRTRGMPWPTEDKEGFFEAYSPALNADKIDTPLLIQSSDREFRLSLMQYAEMLRNDKVIEMFVFPDEGHQFLQPDHKRWVAERNVDWLSFWLTGDEDESFEKAAQYDRWRNMRADHCANMEADAKDLPDYCAAIVGE